jgi:acyl-CoA hydrolase
MVAISSFPTDQIAFACASKFSELLCNAPWIQWILEPIEVGELVTMKASVNYVGKSSMIIGIRVESENMHRNNKTLQFLLFTMVSKTKIKKRKVPGLILSNLEEVRRFITA